MRVSLIAIGNSKGIRIPKAFIKELGIEGELDMKLVNGCLQIKPIKKRRPVVDEFSLASEGSFAKDWNRPEEDEAWKIYQLVK